MRKLAYYILSVLVCSCTLFEEMVPENACALDFQMSVADYGTKASKTAWAEGDRIFAFFDDAVSKSAAKPSAVRYVLFTYDGEKWNADKSHAPSLTSSGTVSAVFCPFGDGTITSSSYSGRFFVSKSEAYYLSETGAAYELDGNVVSFRLDLKLTVPDIAQIHIDGDGLDLSHQYTLSVRDGIKEEGEYSAGLCKLTTVMYRPSDCSFSYSIGKIGEQIKAEILDGGLVCYGLASLGSNNAVSIELYDKTDNVVYAFAKKDVVSFKGGMTINLPSVISGRWLKESGQSTILYSDGTLVINELPENIADAMAVHGAIYRNYGPNANLGYAADGHNQPWAEDREKITALAFGSPFSPQSLSGAFCECSALKSVDSGNLDLSACTSLKNTFKNCSSLTFLDPSGWDVSNVAVMQAAFAGCTSLEELNLSTWNVSSVTDMCYMFQYCYSLERIQLARWKSSLLTRTEDMFRDCRSITELDLSGFSTANLKTMQQMFKNCVNLKTIYASDNFVTTSVSTGASVFFGCGSLVGGNGSKVPASDLHSSNAAGISFSNARIDRTGATGYFTLKAEQYIEGGESTHADSSCVGRTPADVHVSMCLYSDGKEQYVAYYNEKRQMTVAQRTLPTGPWRYCLLDSYIKWDTHNYITMTKNRQGNLLVSGNMHDDPLVFYSTDSDGDVSTLHRVPQLCNSSYEKSVTYPVFMQLSDGRTIFHFRDGRSGSGVERYYIQASDGTWSLYLDTPMLDGKAGGYDMSAYVTGPALGPDGNYHMVWVWRDSYLAETCHDLSYAFSPDLITWYAGSGSKVSLPMNYTQKQLIVDPVPTKGGINNSCIAQGFDPSGRPMISYFKFDSTGNTQVYVARLEDKEWKSYKLTNFTDWRWYFEGGGSLIKQMTVGAPAVEPDGKVTVRYRRYNPDGSKIDGKECWLDGNTLAVLSVQDERSVMAKYPSWSKKVQDTGYTAAQLFVSIEDDSGKAFDGGKYMMRWDHLANNRDKEPVDVNPRPDPSKLIIVKY